jgi:predicted lipid-binding transport protein (Tim44 family)
MRISRLLFLLGVVATAMTFVAVEVADARPRGGGSRGMRTFSAPAATPTAPGKVAPMQRTMTQPSKPTAATAQGAGATGGLFNRPGLLGGLAAGFIGAGLFGLLFGQGLFGNMGGLASVLGLLLQIGLIVIVARLAWAWWQRRNANGLAFAGPSERQSQSNSSQGQGGGLGGALGGGLGGGLGSALGGGAGAGAAAAAPVDDVTIGPEDYDAFEDMLGQIQTAYGREDLVALRALVTPEMLSYFAQDLADNVSRGVRNEIADVKLLQGDLSEAWSEGASQYATLAMRFSLDDRMVERDSGRVVEGGPSEAVEVWTFTRTRGGRWVLSAIQSA